MKKWIRSAVAAILVGVVLAGCASGGGSGAPACACKSECKCGHCSSGGKDACTCSAKK